MFGMEVIIGEYRVAIYLLCRATFQETKTKILTLSPMGEGEGANFPPPVYPGKAQTGSGIPIAHDENRDKEYYRDSLLVLTC